MKNKILEKYEKLFKRIYDNSCYDEQDRWDFYPGIRNNLLSMVGQHRDRFKEQMRTSDIENRLLCLNYTWEKSNRVNRLVTEDNPESSYTKDSLYNIIRETLKNEEDIWRKLRSKKKFLYKGTSRKDPLAKEHKRLFSAYLISKIDKLRGREINAEEYFMILNSHDQWIEKVYEDSKNYMEENNLVKETLLKKANLMQDYEPLFRLAIFNPGIKKILEEKTKGKLSEREFNELCLRVSSK